MDNKTAPMEENRSGNCNSFAYASKSSGSIIQVNPTIDLNAAVEEVVTPACGNFSIRGYVAGMRIKDRKLCLPFATKAGFGNFEDNLPPLHVPRFRWWRCLNHITDSGMGNTTLQEPILPHRNNDHINTSLNVDEGKDGSFSVSCKNITNAEIQDTTVIGCKHSSRGLGDGENTDPSINIPNFNPCQTEGCKASKCGKNGTDVSDKNGNNPSLIGTETNTSQTQDRHANAADISDNRKIDVPKIKTLQNGNGDLGLPVKICDKAVTSDLAQAIGIPSVEGNEPDNTSSSSDDNSSDNLYGRKLKLRYLADILEDEKNPVNESPKFSHASSSKMHVLWPESGATSQNERKTTCEEHKGSPKMIHPRSAAKNLGASTLDVGRKSKRVEISNSNSEDNASRRLELQLDIKTHRIKNRKNKDFDRSKNERRMHTEARPILVLEGPKINAMDSTDMKKEAAAAKTSSFKFVPPTSTSGQTGAYFRISHFGQQVERNSNLCKNKRLEAEAGHKPLVPADTQGESKGKLALDLSLGSLNNTATNQLLFLQRTNPDKGPQRKDLPLNDNEKLPHETTMTRGKQLLNLLENESLPLHKTLDISTSYVQEKARKGQVYPGLSSPQNVEQASTRIECGAPDDVIMEIAELMAKNQYERALGNSRKYFLPETTSATIKESSILHGDGNPSIKNFLLANSINGVNISEDNMEAILKSPNQSAQLNNNQIDKGKPGKRGFKFFSPFYQNQGSNMQFSATSSKIKKSRLGEGEESMWSSRRDNVPFNNVSQNHSLQSNNMGMPLFSNQCHKGKTISDIKGAEEKLAALNGSFPKPGIIRPSPKSMRSLDPCTNHTIPTVQLLSLNDQEKISSPSFNVSMKNAVDKSFSPSKYHQSFNLAKNQNFLNGSSFSWDHNSEKIPGLMPNIYCAGENIKNSSSYLYSGYAGKTFSKSLEQESSGRLGKSETAKSLLFSLQDTSTGVDKQEGQVNRSGLMGCPRQFQGCEYIDLESPQPLRKRSKVEVCAMNLNPADFSNPDAHNEYTICVKELEFLKRNASKELSRSVNVEGQKRRRVNNNLVRKENTRKYSSRA